MKKLSPQFFDAVCSLDDGEAWREISAAALEICSEPFSASDAVREITSRERLVGSVDAFLSSSAWELWKGFPARIGLNSLSLIQWWRDNNRPKAILILDALSLRELPWLIKGAAEHGFTLGAVQANASEIPAETDYFARALGFSGRSSLVNDQASASHLFPQAKTECVSMPWKDSAALVDASPNWIFWHQWPDSFLHQNASQGQGLEILSRECAKNLSEPDFWEFIGRLAQGRKLVITSDHGYAASGYFNDAKEDASAFLKAQLKSGRSIAGPGDTGPFVPPVMLEHENAHGTHRLALGRWKWRSQGGYPTLTHGGMSLLEVLVPWVELSK